MNISEVCQETKMCQAVSYSFCTPQEKYPRIVNQALKLYHTTKIACASMKSPLQADK